MSELLILITGIVFFLLGKYSQTSIEQDLLKRISKPKVSSGVVDLKSPVELNEEMSKSDAEKQSEHEMNKLLSKVVQRV